MIVCCSAVGLTNIGRLYNQYRSFLNKTVAKICTYPEQETLIYTAGGRAAFRRRSREEVSANQRAPILKAYL